MGRWALVRGVVLLYFILCLIEQLSSLEKEIMIVDVRRYPAPPRSGVSRRRSTAKICTKAKWRQNSASRVGTPSSRVASPRGKKRQRGGTKGTEVGVSQI